MSASEDLLFFSPLLFSASLPFEDVLTSKVVSFCAASHFSSHSKFQKPATNFLLIVSQVLLMMLKKMISFSLKKTQSCFQTQINKIKFITRNGDFIVNFIT